MVICKLISPNFSRVLDIKLLSELLLVTVIIQQCKVNEIYFPANAMNS